MKHKLSATHINLNMDLLNLNNLLNVYKISLNFDKIKIILF